MKRYLLLLLVLLACDRRPSDPPPNPPDGVRYMNFLLEWEPPLFNEDGTPCIDLDGYNVYHSLTSGEGYVKESTVEGTSYLIVGLDGTLDHYYVVTAFDTTGNESKYSEEVKIAKWHDIPPPPTDGIDTVLVSNARAVLSGEFYLEPKEIWGGIPVIGGELARLDREKSGTVTFNIDRVVQQLEVVYLDGQGGNESMSVEVNGREYFLLLDVNDDKVHSFKVDVGEQVDSFNIRASAPLRENFRFNYVVVK